LKEKRHVRHASFHCEKLLRALLCTSSRALITLIRAHAPPEKQQLITDLFEKITLYDNRVASASVEKRADGKFDVTLKLKAAKIYVDGKGVESTAAIDDDIDVGIFSGEGDKQKVLYLKKHRINSADPEFKLTVAEMPTEVGFDPYNKLIDRVSRDNRKKL
jgi:ABC-2 type transport system permease protein